MFPPEFDYHRAGDVAEALDLLSDLPDATVLAGGHALLPDLKNGRAEVGAVVDVSDLPELSGVDVGSAESVVGAGTTYAELLDVEEFTARAPGFAEATRAVGDLQIRNRGTVGGNLAAAHPDSDLPAPALVADATLDVRGPDGPREVHVGDLFADAHETTLAADEIVTAVRVPHLPADTGAAYLRKTHPASGYAMVGVAARVAIADGVVTDARIAVTGVADRPQRLPDVEGSVETLGLDGEDDSDPVADATADAAEGIAEADRRGDVHASATFRAGVLPEYVARAVRTAADRADTSTSADRVAGDDGGDNR